MRMIRTLGLAAAVALPAFAFAPAGTAQAAIEATPIQYDYYDRDEVRYRDDFVPIYQVVRRVERRYDEVRFVRFNNGYYVLRGEDRRNRDVRIRVNARTGQIVDVRYTRDRDRDRRRGDDRYEDDWYY